jgi:hypothetical protein
VLQQHASILADVDNLGADAGVVDVLDLDPAVQKFFRVELAFEIENLTDGECSVADDEEALAAEILQQARNRARADQQRRTPAQLYTPFFASFAFHFSSYFYCCCFEKRLSLPRQFAARESSKASAVYRAKQ